MTQNYPAPRAPLARILVVDDEPDLRTLYELTLLREGYRVEVAADLAQARHALDERRFDLLITDMRLPDGLGLDLLKLLTSQKRAERCVVITAFGSADNAVEALKAGAFDYLTKPVDLKQFRAVVASAVDGIAVQASSAAKEVLVPTAQLSVQSVSKRHKEIDSLGGLVGQSPAMLLVKERIVKVARSMAPVLVCGESGTGKELVARAIHDSSHRALGPFVAVNCGAIPDNLIEAEFFGAKKGSYTGAAQDRQGYFQAASGGTLFLDEIGDLPLAMQSKLLRAIQERRVRPLGSTQEDALDVRVVSATHKDVGAQVQTGGFRQDLYYRLNVIDIVLPPLRERSCDLPDLCARLLIRIAQESNLAVPELAPGFLEELAVHPFPGNVRELENLLYRAVALSDGEPLTAAMLQGSGVVRFEPAEIRISTDADADLRSDDRLLTSGALSAGLGQGLDLQNFLDQQEREILSRTLHQTRFNRTAAAQKLGLSLRQIRYRMQRLGISVPGEDDLAEGLGRDA